MNMVYVYYRISITKQQSQSQLQSHYNKFNVFVGLLVVGVQLFHTVNSSLDVRLGVMLLVLQLIAIVIVRHVGRGHDEILFQQRKAMGPHVPLVLLQDNGTAGNRSRILRLHLTGFELSLTVTTHHLIHNRSENARTSRKERIKGVQH